MGTHMKRLPGKYKVFDATIGVAISKYILLFNEPPKIAAIGTGYIVQDIECRAALNHSVRIIRLPMIHGVWCGPCPE